jgi:hypothetical protein
MVAAANNHTAILCQVNLSGPHGLGNCDQKSANSGSCFKSVECNTLCRLVNTKHSFFCVDSCVAADAPY